jgi:hypothetical protein
MMADGALVGTTPAAGAAANPSAVTVTVNKQNPSSFCKGYANYPHDSQERTGVGPGMLIKGQVECPFTGTVTASLTLWICASKPTATDADGIGADPGCSVMRMCTKLLAVQAFRKTDPDDFVCATGQAPVSGSWYIGAIAGLPVMPNVSQAIQK